MYKILMLIIIGIVTCTNLYAEPSVDDQYIRTKIKAFMVKNHIPGVALTLIQNGEPHEYVFGYADRKKKTPVTKYTVFELGSLTKLMTSLILAQQIDYAKMKLDAPLKNYVKVLPDVLSKVTLRDLATHTSGLPFEPPATIKSHKALNQFFSKWQPDGLKHVWQYSNFGMGLLGIALEKSTHRSYEQLYRSRILNPLKMQNLSLISQSHGNDAQGYDEHDRAVHRLSTDFFVASHGIKASISDMQHFLSAAIGLPGTPKRILYPMRLTQSAYIRLASYDQGLGWLIHDLKSLEDPEIPPNDIFKPIEIKEVFETPKYRSDVLIDKTGATAGFRAYIALIPQKKTGIVLLMNKYIDQKELLQTAHEILLMATKDI